MRCAAGATNCVLVVLMIVGSSLSAAGFNGGDEGDRCYEENGEGDSSTPSSVFSRSVFATSVSSNSVFSFSFFLFSFFAAFFAFLISFFATFLTSFFLCFLCLLTIASPVLQ